MSGWKDIKKEDDKPKKVEAKRRGKKKAAKGKGISQEGRPTPLTDSLFTPIDDCIVSDKLKVAVYGDPGSGKSHFAATFPEPIFVIDTENRFARLGSKFPGKDIHVLHCYAEDEEGLFDPVATLYRAEIAISQARAQCKDDAVGTIVIDSASDIWAMSQEYMKVEHLNKDRFALVNREGWNWGIANQRNDSIVMKALVQDCHVVITGKIAYDDAGLTRGTWRKDVPYQADLVLVTQCVHSDEDETTEYLCTIEKCAENGRLQTKVVEDLTYEKLYELVYPSSINGKTSDKSD